MQVKCSEMGAALLRLLRLISLLLDGCDQAGLGWALVRRPDELERPFDLLVVVEVVIELAPELRLAGQLATLLRRDRRHLSSNVRQVHVRDQVHGDLLRDDPGPARTSNRTRCEVRCKTARLALRSWARCAPSGNVAHIAREGVGVLEEQRLLGEEQRATARPPTSARLQEAGELECEVLGLGPVIAEDDSELAALDARVDLALRQVDARRGVMGMLGRQLVELRLGTRAT